MNKTFEYNVKRELFFEHIMNDFYAYKEIKTIGDQPAIISSGITTKEDIEKIDQYTNIKHAEYTLCKTDILEFSRNNLFGANLMEIDEFKIQNPYDYFLENQMKDVSLLKVSYYDYNIYDLAGNKFPKAIYFDYINASMHNGDFVLNKCLDILKNRQDIKLLTEKIVNIPYYNADEGHDKYLSFIWHPSDEDFNKIKALSNHYDIYQYIEDNILKLPRRKKRK